REYLFAMNAMPGPTRPQGPEQQFTVPVPVAPTNPYAGQPVWPSPVQSRPGGRTTAAAGDPLIAQVGVALFWVVVGWWAFVVIRLLGYLTRFGLVDTMLIRTIDRGAEETIVAGVVSVLAAVLLVGVDRTRRAPLTIASVVLALATVGIAVWRVLP
ncbi:hypothetical protein, partial [Terrabacter terrae]|uniref:hypothetical protein n=1 Tax=Terrabacter terrae TaxID=318434 RepID=UPI0031CE35AC